MTATPAPPPALVWDPAVWHRVAPGHYLPRGDRRPCGTCGATTFRVFRADSPDGKTFIRVACERCRPRKEKPTPDRDRPGRMARSPEIAIGRYDATSDRLTLAK